MEDAIFAFFELMGAVAIVGVIAACAASILARIALRTKPKPMIMRGEYRSYVHRQRIGQR